MSKNKKEEIKNKSVINNNEEITPSDFKFDLKPPEDEDDKIITKSNKLRLALYALCFIVIATIISYAAYTYALKSPKDTVIRAYSNTLAEMLETEKIIDGEALKSFLTTVPTETDLTLTYKSSDALDKSLPISLSGSGLNSTVLYDPVNKQAGGSANLTVGGMPIEAAKFYADESALYGKAPLLEQEWVKAPLENMFSAYNGSALSSYFGNFDYTEDFSFNIFDLPELFNIPSSSDVMKEYLASDREVFTSLKEGMYVMKQSGKTTLENGKSAQGYDVAFQSSDLKAFLYDFADYAEGKTDYTPFISEFLPLIKAASSSDNLTAEELAAYLNSSSYEAFRDFADTLQEGSYTLTVYVRNKKIAGVNLILPIDDYNGETEIYEFNLSYPTDKKSDEKLSLDIDCRDSFSLHIETADTEEAKTFNLTADFTSYNAPYTADVTADYDKASAAYSLSARVANSENSDDTFSLSAEGSLLQTENTFDFSADNLKIESGGANLLTIGFDISTKELSAEIEKPDGSITNLFTTDNEELLALVNEIKSNYQSLLGMIALLGLGG